MSILSAEEDCNSIHSFDFTGCSFLAITDFLKKNHSRTAALRVVKTTVDAEKQK